MTGRGMARLALTFLVATVAALVLALVGPGRPSVGQSDAHPTGAAAILGAEIVQVAPTITERPRGSRPLLPLAPARTLGLFAVGVLALGTAVMRAGEVGRLAALSLRWRRRGPPERFTV
jgi:hypothetical protein